MYLILFCLLLLVNHGSGFFGDNVKSYTCPFTFIISKGVNPVRGQQNLDPGVNLYLNRSFSDPWNDVDGEGTRINLELYRKYTDCATIVPVKIDDEIPLDRIDRFTVQHCYRKRMDEQCLLYSRIPRIITTDFNFTLPVVSNRGMLDALMKRKKISAAVYADGTVKKRYHFG